MTDKEKADCLIELHKEQLGKFKQTRDIEFKVNLTFWSFIIIGCYSINKELPSEVKENKCEFLLWYLLISIVIILAHLFFWMKPINKSEDTDDYYINKYRDEVEKLTGIVIPKCPNYNKKAQNWIFFEVGITVLLLILAFIYMRIS